MQNLLILNAVDVRRATQADSSRATTIQKFVIPPVRFKKTAHQAGGSVMDVNYTQPTIEALEPAFSVNGIDTDVFTGFGSTDRWVFAASMRDQTRGVHVPFRAIIEGAVSEWAPDEGSPDGYKGCNHMISGVTHFEVLLDGVELYYIDFAERILRVKGTDAFAGVRNALGA
jgi:uncharacterized protein